MAFHGIRVNKAIKKILNDNLQDEGFKVVRGEAFNTDPGRCPWVGVYLGPQGYDSNTMGRGWKVEAKSLVYVQEASASSQAAEEKLYAAVLRVLEILQGNLQLQDEQGNAILTIQGFEVDYDYEKSEQAGHLLTAEITVLMEDRA